MQTTSAPSVPAAPHQPGRPRGRAGESQPLNPAAVRNTDSCLPKPSAAEVQHDYSGEEAAPGNLWFRWIHGSAVAAKNEDPRIQVMQYNEDTFALRENICVDWRGPFTYLLFGNAGALLIDTGATAESKWYPLRDTVDGLVARWASIRRRKRVLLTVALTSNENRDQNAGLAQFEGRPDCRSVPSTLGEAKSFYGIPATAAEEIGKIDLGGRIIDVIPTPGTHRDGFTFYDRYTDHLFTGDLLFPGKIAIANERDYLASLGRLQDWKRDHKVKWIMGGKVDMQFLPGKAYDRFATFKPYERELQMRPEQIDEALATAREIHGARTVLVRPEFWLMHGVGPDEEPSSLPEGLPDIRAPRAV